MQRRFSAGRFGLAALLGGALLWAPAPEARTCLPDAVAAADRKSVTAESGEATKLKFWGFSWASADIVGSIASIIVAEVLGYDVDYAARGDTSATAIYALAGCRSPGTFHTDPGCDEQGERFHLAMELWDTAIVNREAVFADEPSRLPVRLGQLGYLGVETMYVFGDIRQRAYSTQGLPLEYYLSYDLAWRNAVVFFDRIDTIPTEKLRYCNDTMLVEVEELANYKAVTHDSGGIEIGPSGNVQARCWQDKWWFAPTCRDDPSKCVPLITGGNGWFMYSFMQAATKYRMPLALATAVDWQTYLELPYQHKILMYWWTPDSAFVDEAPVPITFPEFDPALWKAGEKSVASRTTLSKWGSADLQLLAHDVYKVVEAFTLTSVDITALLSAWKASGDAWDVACTWITNSSATWRPWVPALTACRAGFGLVDGEGHYVASRGEAKACASCDIGYISVQRSDDSGQTYVCEPCPVGTSQLRYGDRSCSVCAPGTYSDTAGQSRCTQCGLGAYASDIGATKCLHCPGRLTTASVGSVEARECLCPAGSFAESNASEVCAPCPPGLSCATGSSALHIPTCDALRAGQAASGQWPKPESGHYTSCEEPLSAYLCLNPDACPGGGLEACSGGYVGHLCTGCEEGLYDAGSGCRRCQELSVSVRVLPILCLVVAPVLVFGFHVLVAKAARAMTDRLHGTTLDFCTSLGYILLLFFQVAAKGLQILGGAAEVSPTISTLLGLTLDFDKVFSARCLAELSFEAAFALRVTLPLHAVLLFALCYGFALLFANLPGARGVDLNVAANNLCNVMMALAVTHLEAALNVFRCYQHPNGRYSLLSAPQASCYDGRWLWMAGVSIVLVVAFYAPMLAGLAYIVRQSPQQKHSATFRTRWRFILIRFRSPHVWFIFVVLGRALCVSIATVISTDPLQQFMWLFISCIGYLLLVAVLQPWKRYTLNIIDLWMSSASLVSLVVIFTAAVSFEGRAEARWRLEASLVAPVVCAWLLAGLLSHGHTPPQGQQAIEDLCAVFQLLSDRARLESVLQALCSTDRLLAKNASRALREDLRMRLEFAGLFEEAVADSGGFASCVRAAQGWRPPRGGRVAPAAAPPVLTSVTPQPVGLPAAPRHESHESGWPPAAAPPALTSVAPQPVGLPAAPCSPEP